jgi:PEP-CTERM motif
MARRLQMSAFGFGVLLLGSAYLHAGTVTLTNPGFETGDVSGWTVTDTGQVIAIGATSVTTATGPVWNIYPAGSYMAQIVGSSTAASDLDTFFGLAAGTIESNIPSVTAGDGILQTVTGNAGDVFAMYWSLVETDYPPFNDTVFAVVNQGSTNVLYQNLGCLTGGCPNVVGEGGTQPWTLFTYTLPTSGTYTFGFGAVNTEDDEVPPYLFLDNAAGGFVNTAAAPEPSTYGLLGTGLLGLFAVVRRKKSA